MFNYMMIVSFWKRKKETLGKLVINLFALIIVGCIKDLLFAEFNNNFLKNSTWDKVAVVIDMVVVPIYALILYELCNPGKLRLKYIYALIAPFIILGLLYIVFTKDWIYYLTIAFSLLFGIVGTVFTLFMIPRYNRYIKNFFSYEENINLTWLYSILGCFCFLILLWIINCIFLTNIINSIYMVGSLLTWMLIGYFLNKHENVIEEVSSSSAKDTLENQNEIGVLVHEAFVTNKLYLNPKLKLSDVAKHIGTNRTYLSNYFNKEMGTTFFDYINNLRLLHSEKLLLETDYTLFQISEESGFNSISTFRRAFEQKHNCSPASFRKKKF